MKIELDDKDIQFLEVNGFRIDFDKDYSDDEYLKILEDVYFQEVSCVGIDEDKANRFADIADKIANVE